MRLAKCARSPVVSSCLRMPAVRLRRSMKACRRSRRIYMSISTLRTIFSSRAPSRWRSDSSAASPRCAYYDGCLTRKIPALSEIALFAALSESELQELAQRAVEKHFASDEMLFWEGEECAGIFLLIQGSVKIFRTSHGGREVMLSIESAPTTVAELPLFDGGPYPASVRVVEPVVSLFINKSDFQQVCRQYPDVALKVLAVVGLRLRHLVGLVEAMTFGSVTQRLARLLLDTSKGAGTENFELPVTHQELASRLGTVEELMPSGFSFAAQQGRLVVAIQVILIRYGRQASRP